MKLHLGSDHAGYVMKEQLKEFLRNFGYETVDHGTHNLESTDYPDYAHHVAAAVEEDSTTIGVLLCGSANGVCMTANKHQGIRAALCWTPEVAKLARSHNNANVICIPARFVTEETAQAMLREFLNTPFEGGRHERRVEKISCS